MNKKEAIKAMVVNGSLCKIVAWKREDGLFLRYKNGGFVNSVGTSVDINLFFQDEWEIYKQPKIKMWQWVVQSQAPKLMPELSITFCENEDQLKGYLQESYIIIKRADWTEIEVEETQ